MFDQVDMDRSTNLKARMVSQMSSFSRSNTADYGSLFWTFDPNNHCLPTRITKIIYDKRIIRTWVISWFFVLLMGFSGARLWFLAAHFIRCALGSTIMQILIVLSFNRDAVGFLLLSSEFWIKIAYAAANQALQLIHYHHVGRNTGAYKEIPQWLGYTVYILALVDGPIFMAIVGGMDAIPKMHYRWKVSIMCVTAFLYTCMALRYQLAAPVDEDYIIEIKSTNSIVSFHALLTNVNGMLAMFLWKQAIDVARNKDRCISIAYRPHLRWESTNHESVFMESSEAMPETQTVVITGVD